jgi:hypothetical protein
MKYAFIFLALYGLFFTSCEDSIKIETDVPKISNLSISDSGNGIIISWNIETIPTFIKTASIQRSESQNSFKEIGQTSDNSFNDYYVENGKKYYYRISISERSQSSATEGSTYYSTSSISIISPIVTNGKGSIPIISDLSALGSSKNVNLSWSVPTVDIPVGFSIAYQVKRYNADPSISHSYSYSIFPNILNQPYNDTSFYSTDTLTNSYYYTINVLVQNQDSSIVYIGIDSNTASAIPGS